MTASTQRYHADAAETATKEAATARRPAASPEKKRTVDPVIQQLLKNARSEAVRQEFLSMPPEDYTSKHDIQILVGSQQ